VQTSPQVAELDVLKSGNGGILDAVSHRPFELPDRPWTMTQRWNDLLFAHWPIPVETMKSLIPGSLELDTFDGYAWAGVVPFWMDRIRARVPGTANRGLVFPSVESFPELNLRTYVRSRKTGRAGVFFFALDCANPLAVAGARILFHLPYFLAKMSRVTAADGSVNYQSKRLLTRRSVGFDASYRGLGRPQESLPSLPGSIEHFLTERYCLFTTFRGRVLTGNIHHLPWPLEPCEAEIRLNQLPEAHGLTLPAIPPILHFSRSLEVYLWSLRPDGSV
jgi:uncharacterized protein